MQCNIWIEDRLWLPTIQHRFHRETKKVQQHIWEGIRIYTGIFRTSPVKSLYVEAYNQPLYLGNWDRDSCIYKATPWMAGRAKTKKKVKEQLNQQEYI